MTADKGVSKSSERGKNKYNNRMDGRPAERTHQLIVNCAYFRTAVSFVSAPKKQTYMHFIERCGGEMLRDLAKKKSLRKK